MRREATCRAAPHRHGPVPRSGNTRSAQPATDTPAHHTAGHGVQGAHPLLGFAEPTPASDRGIRERAAASDRPPRTKPSRGSKKNNEFEPPAPQVAGGKT